MTPEIPIPSTETYSQLKKRAVRKWEIKTITRLLERNSWIISYTARDMRMDPANLRRKIRELGIKNLWGEL